jgi:hypothetical protein
MRFTKIEEEVVWCEEHGCVHARSVDPYDYGLVETGEESECQPEHWSDLYVKEDKMPRRAACEGSFCEGKEAALPMHPCPYEQDVNDNDDPCDCCHECMDGCAQEI